MWYTVTNYVLATSYQRAQSVPRLIQLQVLLEFVEIQSWQFAGNVTGK
jgi:hypothetical protein